MTTPVTQALATKIPGTRTTLKAIAQGTQLTAAQVPGTVQLLQTLSVQTLDEATDFARIAGEVARVTKGSADDQFAAMDGLLGRVVPQQFVVKARNVFYNNAS